jgi:hypothetical protein
MRANAVMVDPTISGRPSEAGCERGLPEAWTGLDQNSRLSAAGSAVRSFEVGDTKSEKRLVDAGELFIAAPMVIRLYVFSNQFSPPTMPKQIA